MHKNDNNNLKNIDLEMTMLLMHHNWEKLGTIVVGNFPF